MERLDSRYEVDENGKVKMVVGGESPQKRFTDPSSTLLPREGLLGLMLSNVDGAGYAGSDVTSPMMQRSTSPGSVVDPDEHFAVDSAVPSIAQPLTLHANVFTKISGQLSATAPTATPSPATIHRTSGDSVAETASQFPSAPPQLTTATGSIGQSTNSVASPNRRPSTNRISHLHAFLCTVPHLCTLSMDQITSLRVMVREYDALDSVIETGTNLQHVYVLACGTVEVFDMRQTHRPIGHKRIASITAPNIFGVESLIFDKPSEFTYAASSHETTVLLISKAQFLDLVIKSNIFAHSIGSRLTATMPQFTVFQDFCRAVFSMSSVVADEASYAKCEGYTLHLPSILECYSRIGTVIHPLLHKAEIDVGALQYACARLPANIAETFVINLARSLPPFLSSELKHQQLTGEIAPCLNCSFSHGLATSAGALNTTTDVVRNVTYVSTANRRRSSWRIGDKGHTLILMRDGLTDVIDFMTSFCIHVIEGRKLRIRLQSMISPCAADVLKEAIVAIRENPVSLEEVEELQKHVLGQLPLTAAERAGLASMWPHSAVQKLYNVIMHQEQYIVKVDTSLSKRFAIDAYFHWALKIRSQVLRALGLCDQDTLPPTVEISITSCRNRSIKNLLCSLASTHADAIQEVYEGSADIQNVHFVNDSDRQYYTLFRMINENDTLRQHYGNVLKKCGFSSFEDHTSSGLQLDLIDISRLDLSLVDPYLAEFIAPHLSKTSAKRRFIVNIDFTFGAQAEGIMRSLFLTFGHSITSVNVVGKCAGIRGNRGDVLLPKKLIFSKAAFGEDTTDEIRDCGNNSLDVEEIQRLIGAQRQVLTGPCITIPGMILQNEALIKFYRLVYQAAGMEMEGSYVARQVEECANLSIISPRILTRFVFYMSDMPLGNEDGTKFNARMKSTDTITTMYASIRAALKAVLSSDSPKL